MIPPKISVSFSEGLIEQVGGLVKRIPVPEIIAGQILRELVKTIMDDAVEGSLPAMLTPCVDIPNASEVCYVAHRTAFLHRKLYFQVFVTCTQGECVVLAIFSVGAKIAAGLKKRHFSVDPPQSLPKPPPVLSD